MMQEDKEPPISKHRKHVPGELHFQLIKSAIDEPITPDSITKAFP
jgi:hypothetical protein